MSGDGSADDEDDWFEQGLRDSEDQSSNWEDWDDDEQQSETDDWDDDEQQSGTDDWDDDESTTATVDDTSEQQEGRNWTDDARETADGDATEAESDNGGVADWTQEFDVDSEEDSFEEEFGAGGETNGDAFSGLGDEAASGETDTGSREDEESLFGEGFGDAFGDAGDDADFADKDFESDIPRLDLGIEGLDEMIQGGVPRKHLIVVIGSAGTGKTTFGLQFLHHGLQNGENSVFITLEQSHEDIMATANEWGWDFERYEDDGRLAVVDLDPVEMANSLDNIQAELPQLIKDFGADRLVLDSVSLLEMMYDDQAKRRTEVFDFTRALKKAGVTTFLTSEASESNPYASRHGIIEYLTDAVFVLQYVRGETQETRLAVEIQKIRNANHSREQKPYEMTDEGISVYQQANIF